MSVLAGGFIALILGVILLITWWGSFLTVLAGSIPIFLLIGGALAAYLGFEEKKDREQLDQELSPPPPPPPAAQNPDVENYKAETEKYKAEVEELKKKLQEQTEDEAD